MASQISPAPSSVPVSPTGPKWRPAPPQALHYNPDWTPARRRLFGAWIDVVDGIPGDGDEYMARVKDRLWDGDRLMDDVVSMFRRLGPGEGRRLFEQALEKGIGTIEEPPAELVALFRQLERVPEWIDLAQVDRGALIAANVSAGGKAAGMFLNTILTIQGGTVGAAVGATGRMQRDALYRARETAAFWMALPAPGGLSRFGAGFKNSARVRLLHAQARLMLRRRWGDEWYAQNGMPIPNASIAAGVPTFGIANMMYDMSFGKKYSRREMEDIHAFWTYIGYILGADEDILPRTPEEGIRILDYSLAVAPPPSQYSDELNRVSNLLLNAMMNAVQIPLIDAQVKPYMLQALNGFYFHVGGQALASRITETGGPTFVGRLVPHVIRFLVTSSNYERFMPGRKRRHELNRKAGDPFWVMLGEQFDKLAAEKNDARKPRFNTHDASKPEEMGEPWRQA